MADELIRFLLPDPWMLALAVIADFVIGDPAYRLHPVRIMGWFIALAEKGLRRLGRDGYAGGIFLFAGTAAVFLGVIGEILLAALTISPALAWAIQIFFLYSFLALGDLLQHVSRVEKALRSGDLAGGQAAIGMLVGRDIDKMDAENCRRAAIESLAESLTDGFVSALFWYALLGLPGLIVFKIASTMDSLVGYKTPRYLRFGWFGARLDDAMNYIPARITWLLIVTAAIFVPGASAAKAWRTAIRDHGVLPSPNSGWPEAAMAGALGRRLIGPIWRGGVLVTELWIGEKADSSAGSEDDMRRAMCLALGAALAAVLLAEAAIIALY